MKQLEIQGIWRGKNKRTTRHDDQQKRANDLVKRDFNAQYSNQLWVADFTYIQTHSGWVYTAFIIDVFSRAIWTAPSLLDTRQPHFDAASNASGLIPSIRYTQRLEAVNLRGFSRNNGRLV